MLSAAGRAARPPVQPVIAPLALPPLPRGVVGYEQAQEVDEELDGPSADYRDAAAAVAKAAAALVDAPALEVPEEEVWLKGGGGSGGEEGSGDEEGGGGEEGVGEEGGESPSPAAVRAAARADARAVVAYAAADSRRAPQQPAWRAQLEPELRALLRPKQPG